MTRSEYLAFCGICKNRSFDNLRGIVCGLTEDIANFKNTCPDFEFDDQRFLELERETEGKLFELADKKSGKRYKTKDLLIEYSQLEPKVVYKNSKGVNWFRVVLGVFIIASFLTAIIQDTEDKFLTNPLTYLILLVGAYLIIVSVVSIKDRSPQLIINEEGISSKEANYKWFQIIDAQILEIPTKHTNEYYLQFCIHPSAKLIELSIGELDGTPAQIGATFEFYLQKARS